jgi:hypothetical protein
MGGVSAAFKLDDRVSGEQRLVRRRSIQFQFCRHGQQASRKPVSSSAFRELRHEKGLVPHHLSYSHRQLEGHRPFGGGVGRVIKLGFQPVNITAQFYGNAVHPPGTSTWGLRLQFVLLFPKLTKEQEKSEPQKKISKKGDRYLRTMMVQGAHYILGPFGEDSDLRRWGLKLAERGGKNAKKRAVVAVARKLAVLLHRLWVSGEVYEPLRNSQKAMCAVA